MLPRRFQSIVVALLTIHFAIVPAATAASKYKILHAFGNGQDGAGTWGSLLLDTKGNLYGTTGGGGLYGYGTAFELTPKAKGRWHEAIVHNFDRNGQDGYDSTGNLIFGDEGALYGTTTYGGAYDYGTVFVLTPGSGGWKESVLFSFDVTDGARPYGGVVMDKNGNLYGTADIVFELASGSGGWTESVIDDFSGHNDGSGTLRRRDPRRGGRPLRHHRGGRSPHLGHRLQTYGSRRRGMERVDIARFLHLWLSALPRRC